MLTKLHQLSCHNQSRWVLPFLGLSQNRSPRKSPRPVVLWCDMSYKGLRTSNSTTPVLSLSTQWKPHCYLVFWPLWDPLATRYIHMAHKMGLEERRNGSGGVRSQWGGCLWEKGTRESFHVCPINAEGHRHYKFKVQLGRTLPLCSLDTMAYILHWHPQMSTGEMHTECLVRETS